MKEQTFQMPCAIRSIEYEPLFASAAGLLGIGEYVPHNVFEIIRYCQEKKIIVVFSRNEPAGSCIDASRKRIRSGAHAGIPLHDEMKTLVVTYLDAGKRRQNAAVHCRGDQSINFSKVARLLPECDAKKKAHISLLDELSLTKMYRLCYGIVNPVLLDIRSKGLMPQIFDAGLPGRPSPCMMTNAGEHTWGMEFDVSNVIGAIDHYIIGSICK